MPNNISDDELIAYVQLCRSEGVGAITFNRLMKLYGTAGAALEHLPELSARGGRKKPLKAASKASAKQEIDATHKHGGEYLVWGKQGYPKMLKSLPDAPPILAAFGHTHLLDKPSIAIVGARNASAAAQKLTAQIAKGISENDFVVISGLARGIDGAAHSQSLEGGTIAVIANGADKSYPAENKELQEKIIAQGLVLTEHPIGAPPQAQQFPRRNRVISGLALGVVVVEAARKSGSLITATLAAEQGREVMAVPSSPLDTRGAGSNNLIRDGAAMVESADDVLALMRPHLQQNGLREDAAEMIYNNTTPPTLDTTDREKIISLLGPTPLIVDELVEASGLSVAQVHTVLVELSLAQRLTQEAGGRVSLLD